MNDLENAALSAANTGWPVFMLGRSKRPVANCEHCKTDLHDPDDCDHLTCHGFYAASNDPFRVAQIVQAVPNGQLALRTGARARLVVVDVDPAHGGSDSLADLIRRELVPRTLWVLTGSGGVHLYYRHPGHPIASRPMPKRPGIDIKADGGYVVLPPSTHHRTRKPYQWGADPATTEPAEMPPALIDACMPVALAVSPAARPEPTTRRRGGISHPDRLLRSHLNAVRNAPEGRRRTTLYGASRGVARMVLAGALDQADAVAALTAVGQEVEQSARDIQAAIAGGFHDEGIAA
jgi:hypothetical protein